MRYDPQFVADVLGVPVAMNSDHKWHWFRNKPTIGANQFMDNTLQQGDLPDVFAYVGDWQDSLRMPGFSIALPDNAVVLQSAKDFRFRFANRIDTYLKDGYQLVGEIVEKKGKFYRTVVKLDVPPVCPLSGYRIVKASEADKYQSDGWRVASAPFFRADGELFVELIKREEV